MIHVQDQHLCQCRSSCGYYVGTNITKSKTAVLRVSCVSLHTDSKDVSHCQSSRQFYHILFCRADNVPAPVLLLSALQQSTKDGNQGTIMSHAASLFLIFVEVRVCQPVIIYNLAVVSDQQMF